MASHNGSFESHVMCPVCLDTYKNPMSLKCRHSMCKQCIDRLVKRNGDVMCPQCRTLSRAVDVVKDFQLKSIVDTYKAKAPAPKYPCSICQAATFGSYCQQCKILICNQCQLNHRNIPTCRDHSFSFESYHKDHPLASQFKIEEVEKLGIGSTEAMSHFTKCMADMEKFACDKINKAETRAINEIKEHHTYLKLRVTAECKAQKKLYKKKRSDLKKVVTGLRGKIKTMLGNLRVPDSQVTAETVVEEKEKLESVTKEVNKIKKDYSLDKMHTAVATVVKEGEYLPGDSVYSKHTSLDFASYKLCRNGKLIENVTEEWSNMSCISGYQPGDRLLTPTRSRRTRSFSRSPQRRSRSPSPPPPQRLRYRSPTPPRQRHRSPTPLPQRDRSRSPLAEQRVGWPMPQQRDDSRPGPSQESSDNELWDDRQRYLRSESRGRGWSRSRSSTPVPGYVSSSRSRSYSPSSYHSSYYNTVSEGSPRSYSYQELFEDSNSNISAVDNNYDYY